jgi:hypothetical protein
MPAFVSTRGVKSRLQSFSNKLVVKMVGGGLVAIQTCADAEFKPYPAATNSKSFFAAFIFTLIS